VKSPGGYRIQRLLLYEHDIAGYFFNILKRVGRDPYFVIFWSCFFLVAHLDLASLRLMVGPFSASEIQASKARRFISLPGREGDARPGDLTIFI
jgi:hypothetical protein